MSKFKAQFKKEEETFLDLKIHNIGHEACDPLHSWSGIRDFYSIHTIVSGKGYYKVNEKEFDLGIGDTFLIFPNTRVHYYADEENPWEYLWLGISGLYVKNIIESTEFTVESPILKGNAQTLFKEDLQNIYNFQGSDFASELNMIGFTYLFLSKLVTSEKQNQFGDRYAYKAKEFIELNYSNGITSQQVADKMNISRSHLHRLFSQTFDTSVGKYINSLQMNRATLLLTTTSLSIGEISCSIGFENQLYFSNVFKKLFGISPSEYRKKKSSI